jgi:hypothetical protein
VAGEGRGGGGRPWPLAAAAVAPRGRGRERRRRAVAAPHHAALAPLPWPGGRLAGEVLAGEKGGLGACDEEGNMAGVGWERGREKIEE